jgi:hypothetical protein
MKISKAHLGFSYHLDDPKALTNPEDFLGPNWQDVINFWLYVDGLSEDEKYKMDKCHWASDVDVRRSALRDACSASEEVVGQYVTYPVLNSWDVHVALAYATLELLAHHKLLEQDKTLVFLPLCLNP